MPGAMPHNSYRQWRLAALALILPAGALRIIPADNAVDSTNLRLAALDASQCLNITGVATLVAKYKIAAPADNLALVKATVDAYFWALAPLQLLQLWATANASAVNTFYRQAVPDNTTASVTNFDVLDSYAFVDVSSGPVVLTVPKSTAAFWHLTAYDFFGGTVATLGRATTITSYLIIPAGYTGYVTASYSAAAILTATYPWMVISLSVDVQAPASVTSAISLKNAPGNSAPSQIPIAAALANSLLDAATNGPTLPTPMQELSIFSKISTYLPKTAAFVAAAAGYKAAGINLVTAHPNATKLARACLIATVASTVKINKNWVVPIVPVLPAGAGPVLVHLVAAALATNLLYGSQPDPYQPAVYAASDAVGTPLGFPRSYNWSLPKPPTTGAFYSIYVYNAVTQTVVSSWRSDAGGVTPNPDGTIPVYIGSTNPGSGKLFLDTAKGPVIIIWRGYLNTAATLPTASGRRRLLQTSTVYPSGLSSSVTPPVIGTGYNLYTGCPLSTCIGSPSDPGLLYSNVFALAPTDVNLNNVLACTGSTSTATYLSSADQQSSVSVSLGASGTYDGVTASANAGFSSSNSQNQYSQNILLASFQTCVTTSASLASGWASLTLNPAFLKQIVSLVGAYTPTPNANWYGQVNALLSSYGVGFIQSVSYGGINNLQSQCSNSAYASMQSSGYNWGASASAETASITAGGNGSSSQANSLASYKCNSNYVTLPLGSIPQTGTVDTNAWSANIKLAPAVPVKYTIAVFPQLMISAPGIFTGISASQLATAATQLNKDFTTCGNNHVQNCQLASTLCANQFSYAKNPGQFPPQCVSCSSGPNKCAYGTSTGCSTTGQCQCKPGYGPLASYSGGAPYTAPVGTDCSKVDYGTCQYTQHGSCKWDWNSCNPAYPTYQSQHSVHYCQCQCCSGVDCGYNALPNWGPHV